MGFFIRRSGGACCALVALAALFLILLAAIPSLNQARPRGRISGVFALSHCGAAIAK